MTTSVRPALLRWVSVITGILFLACIGISQARAVAVSPPTTLAYQGYLTSSSGQPVNASVSMSFALYDAASGGTALWHEAQTVAVSNGAYAVTLGSTTPIDLPFDTAYYLGITIGSDGEMSPRQALSSVGYAFSARTVQDGAITTAKLADGAVTAAKFSGHIKLGTTSSVCDSASAGAIRWSGTRFEGCDGTGWTPFAVASCSDGVKNGTEADVDCGGGCSSKCTNGSTCSISADCSSGNCSGGVCAVPSCSDGIKNGSETDVDCGGSCTNKCATGRACSASSDCVGASNASGQCTAGVCTLACNGGFSNCDGTMANGCEASTGSDPNNCGSCGRVCFNYGNGTPICSGGSCGMQCNAGYTNCSGVCYDLTADANHCGACGTVCPLGKACSFGTCR